MKINYAEALKFVLAAEGGYSDDPADPGGATMHGIIQTEYDSYRTSHGEPHQPVKQITMAEVEDIYRSKYWAAIDGDALASPVDIVLFDTAVNIGKGWAVRLLCRALTLPEKNVISPAIVAACAKEPVAVAGKLIEHRNQYYQTISTEHPVLRKFLKGWLARDQRLKTLAHIG